MHLFFVVVNMARRENLRPNSVLPEPSPRLLGTILERIKSAKRRQARMRLMFFSVVLTTSAAGFVPAYQLFQSEFYGSGFAEFLSLLFSDPEVAIAYWQDFALSLLELLPLAGLATLLAILLIFLSSLRAATREVKNSFT